MPMKKFINNPEKLTAELLDGYVKAYSNKVALQSEKLVVRAQPKDASKVAVVTLGGSGHEPALSGFVGEGMLDISVVGEFLTVQEMAGFQMFVAKMDDELLQLWDASCDTPYLTVR